MRTVNVSLTPLLDVLFILIFVMLLLPSGTANEADYREKLAELEAALAAMDGVAEDREALEIRLAAAQSEAKRLKDEISKAQDVVKGHENSAGELETAVRFYEEKIESLQDKVTQQAQDLGDAAEEKAQQQGKIGDLEEKIAAFEEVIEEFEEQSADDDAKRVVPLKNVDVCNFTRVPQQLAFAHYDVSDNAWVSEGWTIIEVNACTKMIFNSGKNHLYYYSITYGSIPNEDMNVVGRKFCVRMRNFRFPDSVYIKNAAEPRECLRYAGYHIVRFNLLVSQNNDGNDDNSAVLHMYVIE